MTRYDKYNEISFVFGDDVCKSIKNLYDKISTNSELEFIFDNIDYEKYMNVKTYIHNLSKIKKSDYILSNTLDIIYTTPGSSYRLTINDVSQVITQLRIMSEHKSNVIYNKIFELIKSNQIEGTIIKKTRGDIIKLEDFNLRVKLSTEKKIDNEQDFEKINKMQHNSNIFFRKKDRLSFNNDGVMIDLTSVKMSSNFKKLLSSVPKYELEIEINNKKVKFENFLNNVGTMLKVVNQTNYIMPVSLSKLVINEYYNILKPRKKHILDLRNTKGLEKSDLILLKNEYCVTDKADGNRHLLLIYDGAVFLISMGLQVFNTGIVLKNHDYDGTMCDGELLFIAKKRKHLFMMFDCLFFGREDVRNNNKFENRLKKLDQLVLECFVHDKQNGQKINDFNKKFDVEEIIKFHDKQINTFSEDLNNDLNYGPSTIIRRKYFMFVYGGHDSEIYKYTLFLWNKYKYDKKNFSEQSTLLPYELDGLIFQPQNQEYIVSNKSKVDYKWKPSNTNSIDFYIEFHKQNDVIATYFDNSDNSKNKNAPYKLCHLYVGDMSGDTEVPVLFKYNNEVKLYLTNGEVRDITTGLPIKDKTVVEFIYDDDANIWIPIKTRYDKTYNVLVNNRGYGNFKTVAESNWRSIIDPITPTVIESYGNGIYDKKTTYYEKVTDVAEPMRKFHNWIKETLIFTYCFDKSVVDIGCGRGGDIMKFYNAGVKYVLGIDSALNNLTSPIDGALKRYENLKLKHQDIQKMDFVHFDICEVLNEELRQKGKFDILNCQFAVHYFLENEIKWKNFCDNVNLLLNDKGYALFTTFDGDIVNSLLADGPMVSHIITPNGDKQKLFEISYVNKNTIMVYNSLISNTAMNEMIVIPSFFIKELKNKCNLTLVETGLFSELYKNNEDFFKLFKNHPAYKYYDMNDNVNVECFKFTKLNRFYIFKK